MERKKEMKWKEREGEGEGEREGGEELVASWWRNASVSSVAAAAGLSKGTLIHNWAISQPRSKNDF
jgi:hypothetical protein